MTPDKHGHVESTPDAIGEALAEGIGFKQTPSGLHVPSTMISAGVTQESWPTAKIELIERVGKWLAAQGVTMLLLCTDVHCRDDATRAMVKRVDVGEGVFVLGCAHKLRVCNDRKVLKKALRARRRRGRS